MRLVWTYAENRCAGFRGGTNLQALIDAVESGYIKGAKITTVVSSRPGVFALDRAAKHGIATAVISRKSFGSPEEYDQAIVEHLMGCGVGLVVMAGFLSILGHGFNEVYRNKVINVHPSLIPAFCGKGFYGLIPHQKALEYGVKVTGATVHFVEEETDAGPIILQKAVEIHQGDTPETLQKRVMEQAEWVILKEAVRLFAENKLRVNGRIVEILP